MNRFSMRALLVSAALLGFVAKAALAQVDVNVTIGGFYDELAPYGRWVDCSYGQCWVPARVAADWQPYSNGQWIYTEYGWTWVSSDPWGGNPYHYGTWASIEGYGWSWVPGTVWAPAWVTWSYSNNYVGWAPLPPTVVFGASGYAGSPIVVSQTQYVFVPTNRFVGRNVSSVRVPMQQSAQVFRETRPVTGFAVSGGIVRNTALPMATIERAAGSKIETRQIQVAGTAPRAFSAGTGRVAIVAPPREVKAAVAARPQAKTVAQSPQPSREEKAAQAPANHGSGSAKAPKSHEARPVEPNSPAANAPARQVDTAPAARVQAAPRSPEPVEKHANSPVDQKPNAKAHKAPEPPPMESHQPVADKPQHQQQPPRPAEANRQAEKAPKPKPAPAGKEKPAENDKKPDEKPGGEKP